MPHAIVDLRSDTVTRPSMDMRRVIAAADVGDDMYGEDPTVNLLQEKVADLLGQEAALFVPTGSMANQIAIKTHTQPGEGMIVGAGSHNWMFEAGAAGFISGIQVTVIPGDGRYTAAEVEACFLPDLPQFAPTRLLSVENTHNMAGGAIWCRNKLDAVLACADRLHIAKHLDGARLWNAAAASGQDEASLAAGFDTVSVCLSKGLGAPVGSLLCGRRETILRAYRYRRVLGGSMRQAGILAAAGLFALEHNRARLAVDHDNARWLAEALNTIEGLSVSLDGVQTNMVMVDIDDSAAIRAHTLVERCQALGVRFFAVSAHRIRLVTHLDVDRADCERALDAIAGAMRA